LIYPITRASLIKAEENREGFVFESMLTRTVPKIM